jgi:hypothetical protein
MRSYLVTAQVISLQNEKQRWNQRWRFDPAFKQGFDYEKPEYATCPDDMRWLLPLAEHQKSPEYLAYLEESKRRAEMIVHRNRLETIRLISAKKPRARRRSKS